MPERVPEPQVQDAVGQLDSVRREWLRRPGVTGVDVGFKISRKQLTGQLAIRVHVERKLPIEALPQHEVFSVSGKPEQVGPFPIDVIEARYGILQGGPTELDDLEDVDRFGRVDPLVAGVSIANPRTTAGTLGAIVWDRTDGSVNVLTNWHILACSPNAMVGEPIFQPGEADGGTAADTVATLNRFRLDATMDAAIARLNGSRGFTRDIVGLSPILGIEDPAVGMLVVKSGRMTAVTKGIIDGLSFSGTLKYGHGPNTFHDQIHIVPRPPWPSVDDELSQGGDSGAVWIDEDTGNAVGLHFGGEVGLMPEHALANRMGEVSAASGLNFSFTPLFQRGGVSPTNLSGVPAVAGPAGGQQGEGRSPR